jgi:hypothetical protein
MFFQGEREDSCSNVPCVKDIAPGRDRKIRRQKIVSILFNGFTTHVVDFHDDLFHSAMAVGEFVKRWIGRYDLCYLVESDQ